LRCGAGSNGVLRAVVIDLPGLSDATELAEQAVRVQHPGVAIERVREPRGVAKDALVVLPFRLRYLRRAGYRLHFARLLGRARNARIASGGRLMHPLVPVLWAMPLLFPIVSVLLIIESPVYLWRHVIRNFFLTAEDRADPIVAYGAGRAAGGVTYWNLLADKARRYGIFGLAHDTYMGKPLSVHSWPLAVAALRTCKYRAYTALSLLLLFGAFAWAAIVSGHPWFLALMPLLMASTFLTFNLHVGTWELLAWGIAALSIVAFLQGLPVLAGFLAGVTLLAHPGVAQMNVSILIAATLLPSIPFMSLVIAGLCSIPPAIPFAVPYWRARHKLGRGRILNTITLSKLKWEPASVYQMLAFIAIAIAFRFSPAPRAAIALHLLAPLVQLFNTKIRWVFSNYTVFNLVFVAGAIHIATWGGTAGTIVWLLVIFTPGLALLETPSTPLAGLPLDPVTLGETGRRLQATFGPLRAGRVAFENDGLSNDMSSAVATITYAVRELPIELLNAAYTEIGDSVIYFKYIRPLNPQVERDVLIDACREAGVKYVVAFTDVFRARLTAFGLKEIAREEGLALAHYPNRGVVTLTIHELEGAAHRIDPEADLHVEPNRITFPAKAGIDYRLAYTAFAGWRATVDGTPVPIRDAHPGMLVTAGRDGLMELRYRYRHYFGL